MSDKGPLLESNGQITFHWKIEKFFSLPIADGTFAKSPGFLFSNERWYVMIYTNGDNKTKSSGWINLYLCCNSITKNHIEYRLGILKTDGSEFLSKVSTAKFDENMWGLNNLISRSDLLKSKDTVAPDGTLTVFCTINMIPKWTIEVTSKRPASDRTATLSEDLKDSYYHQLCADITLKVQNREFFANKFILMTRSTVFASMFNHEMIEKRSGIVEIDDCDPDSFEEFLLFLYTGELNCVTLINAISLYKTADKYNVLELKVECVRCMVREISVDSFCDIVRFASLHDENNLLSTASDFFIKNAEFIITMPNWVSLLEDKPSLGNEFFSKCIKNKSANECVREVQSAKTIYGGFSFCATNQLTFGN